MIHKDMKITSNPSEKLVDHCVEHKINKRNNEGYNPCSHLCSSSSTFLSSLYYLFVLFFSGFSTPHLLVCDFAWLLNEMVQEVSNQLAQASDTCPSELVPSR